MMKEGAAMRVSTENTTTGNWLDQFPDGMTPDQIAVSPEYVINVAREVIAESAYGLSVTSTAANVQLTSALLALLVAADWFGFDLEYAVAAGDAPTQRMIASAIEMSPRASYSHGEIHVLHMDGAAADMFANMDVLSVRMRFMEARNHLPKGFDFPTFVNKLGGAFACAVSTFDVKGVC